jgi:hypothetical protein
VELGDAGRDQELTDPDRPIHEMVVSQRTILEQGG